MGRKVFVSYKYSDVLVQRLSGTPFWENTTVRDYVDVLSETLEGDDHIYKGEDDGESMATLSDAAIGSKLGDKIFDSSVTIVLVSKGMKEAYLPEKDQWIPWEVSYSLKEQSRQYQSSKTNGVIAVILPDELGSYSYYITYDGLCDCRSLNTPFLFQILKDNMFNKKEQDKRLCNGSWVHSGDCSYIQSVKWESFIKNPTRYIDKAIELRDKKYEYEIIKNIK